MRLEHIFILFIVADRKQVSIKIDVRIRRLVSSFCKYLYRLIENTNLFFL